MLEALAGIARWLLGPETAELETPDAGGGLGSSIWSATPTAMSSEIRESGPGHLWPRWIFLRALGLIYLSAFYSLLFQIKGLLGPGGILPAGDYLQAVAGALHAQRFLFAPTLLWLGSSNHALMWLCWVGIIASLCAVLNFWPRGMLAVCFVCFLSFVAAAQDFSGYQSDGMLLEAGFISLFFAPPGIFPGLGKMHAPSRLSRFLLLWEWFRIYFESGVVKIASGDLAWRNLTAMDDYYQNGPLPTWLGWYVAQLPHWYHASTVILTFAVELALAWMVFLPRRFRIICFCIVTPFEIGIILTANYAFLNYLVLALGFLLLDDRVVEWILPQGVRKRIDKKSAQFADARVHQQRWWARSWKALAPARMTIAGFFLGWVFYSTAAQLVWTLMPGFPLPDAPVRYLEPFRIANRYGLFAVMTHGRYEIEFQGSTDGKNWIAYPFHYKPQDPAKAPGIYAPYQPRFEWNLWFASLGSWREYRWGVWTEERLLSGDPGVMSLFAANPFAGRAQPVQVRAVIWQYWFTDLKTKREQKMWWRREILGEYAPALEREPDGKIAILDVPTATTGQE